MTSRYETEWKAAEGWTVTFAAGPPELSLSAVFHFEGYGDGAWDSVMMVDGIHEAVGRGCRYDVETDAVTLSISGQDYRLTRAGQAGHSQIRASLVGPGGTAGGSWTAEEGTSGVRGKDEPPRTSIPRAAPAEVLGRA